MSRIEAALRDAQAHEDEHLLPTRKNGARRNSFAGISGAKAPTCLVDNLRREVRALRRPVLGLCALRRGEGTSTLTAYLAGQFALDQRVLAIDCNFEFPKLHDLFGTGEGAGTSEILLGEKRLQDCLLPVPGSDSLFLLPAGRCGVDALPFLGSLYSARLFEEVKDQFDIILFDAPSDSTFSGTIALCLQADGVVWVVQSGTRNHLSLEETLEIYRDAGVNLLGAALNRAQSETPHPDLAGNSF